MKKLILVMGDLASLKTTISRRLSSDLNIICFNKDMIKEKLVDVIGFSNRQENKNLSQATYEIIKYNTGEIFHKDIPLIIESNFKYHEINDLIEYLGVSINQVLVLFLSGDSKILYQRYCDRQPFRHQAHTSTGLISYDHFVQSKLEFKKDILGLNTYSIDTSNFTDRDYEILKLTVKDYIEKKI